MNPHTASITCPVCHWTSRHPKDVAEGYCGHCRDWTGTAEVVLTTILKTAGINTLSTERGGKYMGSRDKNRLPTHVVYFSDVDDLVDLLGRLIGESCMFTCEPAYSQPGSWLVGLMPSGVEIVTDMFGPVETIENVGGCLFVQPKEDHHG